MKPLLKNFINVLCVHSIFLLFSIFLNKKKGLKILMVRNNTDIFNKNIS